MNVNLIAKAILIIGVCFLLGGCRMLFKSPAIPPVGTTFSNIGAPVDLAYDNTEIGDMKGQSKAVNVLGLISFGDCSVRTAARNAGIDQIDHVDMEYLNVLGIYQSYNTIVWGRTK